MADMRKCIGSARFGIEPHEAQLEDFPVQPSQKDGLGRMCKAHWNQYTTGLARDAKARKAADGAPSAVTPTKEAVALRRRGAKPQPIRTRPPRKTRDTAPPTSDVAQEATAD